MIAAAQPYHLTNPVDIYGSTVFEGERFVRFYET